VGPTARPGRVITQRHKEFLNRRSTLAQEHAGSPI
jgi:hypothetical protein